MWRIRSRTATAVASTQAMTKVSGVARDTETPRRPATCDLARPLAPTRNLEADTVVGSGGEQQSDEIRGQRYVIHRPQLDRSAVRRFFG